MPDEEAVAGRGGEPAAYGATRRGLLRGAAGLGVAGLAAGFAADRALAPAAASAAARDAAAGSDQAAAHDEPLIVHVHDARTGVVDLFTGTRHVRFSDPQLAARLALAAR
jgi:hypothetical protein